MAIEKSQRREVWFYAAGRLCCAELFDYQPSGVKIERIRLQSGEVLLEHKVPYLNDDLAREAAMATIEDWAQSKG